LNGRWERHSTYIQTKPSETRMGCVHAASSAGLPSCSRREEWPFSAPTVSIPIGISEMVLVDSGAGPWGRKVSAMPFFGIGISVGLVAVSDCFPSSWGESSSLLSSRSLDAGRPLRLEVTLAAAWWYCHWRSMVIVMPKTMRESVCFPISSHSRGQLLNCAQARNVSAKTHHEGHDVGLHVSTGLELAACTRPVYFYHAPLRFVGSRPSPVLPNYLLVTTPLPQKKVRSLPLHFKSCSIAYCRPPRI
jgi:hypothetical protein